MEQYEKLKQQLLDQVQQLSKATIIPSKLAAKSIPLCREALEKLKILVSKNSFKSLQDEIFFFRNLKPEITSTLIFFLQLHDVESRKPSGTSKQLKKYFNTYLKTINQFKDDNLGFYQYYRNESIFLDEKYFTRCKSNFYLVLDPSSFNYDATFNTSHDHKVAQILANDRLTDYLHNELNKLDGNLFTHSTINLKPTLQLKWTDNKNALIELIYALQASGSFNNGKADVKEIAESLAIHFDIDLTELYRYFHDLRYRKNNRTKYLDTLKQNLIKKMDMIDEKLN